MSLYAGVIGRLVQPNRYTMLQLVILVDKERVRVRFRENFTSKDARGYLHAGNSFEEVELSIQ